MKSSWYDLYVFPRHWFAKKLICLFFVTVICLLYLAYLNNLFSSVQRYVYFLQTDLFFGSWVPLFCTTEKWSFSGVQVTMVLGYHKPKCNISKCFLIFLLIHWTHWLTTYVYRHCSENWRYSSEWKTEIPVLRMLILQWEEPENT